MSEGIGHNGGPPLEDTLSVPQFELVTSSKRFPAMVAGFGSGKTEALVKRALRLKFEFWGLNVGYYLPTYDLIKTIATPRFQDVLAQWGYYEHLHYTFNKSDSWIDFAPMDGGKIIMRTMDNPGRIIGYEVADSCVDELDTLKAENAADVWRKIIARNRQKKPMNPATGRRFTNSVAVGTTPEGFRFVYENWHHKPPSDQYQLIRATTYSNRKNLPADYIQDLTDAYPANLVEAYINGEFINLTSGSVYPNYDRTLNNSTASIFGTGTTFAEDLHIGLDFNVTKMSAVIFVNREGWPNAVTELTSVFDTPAMIQIIKERWQDQGHRIFIYPDASGNARKSVNASLSDLSLLRQAGFTVFANGANPAVRDRVLAKNAMLHSGNGLRRMKVNAEACPIYASSLEQQAYDKNGEPDKTQGKDHINDAGGYFIVYRFPVIRNTMTKVELGGV